MRILLLLAALVFSSISYKDGITRDVQAAETPTGRSFYFMPIDEEGVTDVTITIAWPMQWAYEAEKNPAAPYVAAEAILSGGTDDLAPQDVLALFNDKNASGRLYVVANHAIGELSFPHEHMDEIVAVASEMLSTPQFEPKWLSRIKQGIVANQTRAQSQTLNQMWAVARRTVLGEQPLLHFLSLHDMNFINDVQESDVRRWHQETIVQPGVTIAVAGAISAQNAGNAIDQLLSGLPTQSPEIAANNRAEISAKAILLHLPNAEKSSLGFVGSLPPASEGDELTDLLAVHHFARAGSGSLFDAVRIELRASYGFQAGIANYDRANRLMFLGGEIETAKLSEASELVLRTYESYRTKPDFTGFEELRRGIADGTSQNLNFVDVAARTILELALNGRNPSDAPQLGELIKKIQAEDVQKRLAADFPTRSRLIVVAASPDANALPGACVISSIEQVAQCP